MFLHHALAVCTFAVLITLLKEHMSTAIASKLGLCAIAGILTPIVVAIASKFLPSRLLPRLEEKAVLITGCDTGFGHSLALRLDSLGLTVYAGCLQPDGPGAQKLKSTTSSNLHIVPLNVTMDEDVKAALQYVKSTIGDKVLWAIVNNAGIITMAEIEWISMEKVISMFDVNTFGQMRVTCAFLPMLRQSKGRVVNVNSFGSNMCIPTIVPYCMSKYASKAFTDGLRTEILKFSISVHSIEPVIYSNGMTTQCLKSFSDNWKQCPKDIKEAYGMNYETNIQSTINHIGWFEKPESKMYLVINAMMDACIGKEPKENYYPSLQSFFGVKFNNWTPQFILKYILKIMTQENVSFKMKVFKTDHDKHLLR